MRRAISRRRGPDVEAVLTLPILFHPTDAVLSTLVRMWASGDVRGKRSASCTGNFQ